MKWVLSLFLPLGKEWEFILINTRRVILLHRHLWASKKKRESASLVFIFDFSHNTATAPTGYDESEIESDIRQQCTRVWAKAFNLFHRLCECVILYISYFCNSRPPCHSPKFIAIFHAFYIGNIFISFRQS